MKSRKSITRSNTISSISKNEKFSWDYLTPKSKITKIDHALVNLSSPGIKHSNSNATLKTFEKSQPSDLPNKHLPNSISHENIFNDFKNSVNLLKTPQTPRNSRNFAREILNYQIPRNYFAKDLKRSPRSIENPLESIISKVAFRTKIGLSHGRNKLNNQDEYLIIQNFAKIKNLSLLGIFDGHGVLGHEVSKYIKQNLPILMESYLPAESNQ